LVTHFWSNSSKIRAANFDLAYAEGVAAKVQFPNPCIGAASPFSVRMFLKVLAGDFSGERIFRCNSLPRLRTRKVGGRDNGKRSGDDVSLE
jgi:hypothetical protein